MKIHGLLHSYQPLFCPFTQGNDVLGKVIRFHSYMDTFWLQPSFLLPLGVHPGELLHDKEFMRKTEMMVQILSAAQTGQDRVQFCSKEIKLTSQHCGIYSPLNQLVTYKVKSKEELEVSAIVGPQKHLWLIVLVCDIHCQCKNLIYMQQPRFYFLFPVKLEL